MLNNENIKKTSTNISFPDILQVADVVAKEQGIDKEAVFESLELALQKPALLKYGQNNDIKVSIDRETGQIRFYRKLKIVTVASNTYTEISYDEAQKIEKNCKIGEDILETLPAIEFDRVAAQISRQVIGEKLRETRRALHFKEYKDRVGDLITVIVKKNEITYILVEFGNKAEGIIKKSDLLPGEKLQVGERTQAVIKEVTPESYGPVVILSRTSPQFLMELMKKEINEVYEGIIEIKAAARDPGSRSKVAVYSPDTSVDSVGACIGIRGARIQAVSTELMGEKIDVIEWSSDPATFVINALAPAEITKVIIDEEKNCIEVVVPKKQLSVAIGRKGQNIKLASALTGWRITILTEENETERSLKEMERISNHFMETLNVDDMMGRLLAAEGYNSVEQIYYESLADLASIEGLDIDLAKILKSRAEKHHNQQVENFSNEMINQGVEQDFIDFKVFNLEQKKKLTANNVKSLQDVAFLSSDELIEILGEQAMSKEDVNEIIMDLRSKYLGIDQG